MKNKLSLILVLCFLCILNSYGQRIGSPCSRDLYAYTDNPSSEDLLLYSNNLDTFLFKYVSRYFSDGLNYLTNDKSDLETIPVNIKLRDYVRFETIDSNGISIEIRLQENKVSPFKDSLDVLSIDTNIIIVDKIRGNSFFGIVQSFKNDTIFQSNVIDMIKLEIRGNSIYINKIFYKDLINPNLNNMYRSFKPIESYYSKSKKLIYIYIYGDLPNLIPDNDYFNQHTSYLCKLIIKPNGDTYRIVIPTKYLKYYGWIECAGFWGF